MLNPLGLAYAFGYALLLASVSIVLRSLSERLSPSLIIGLRGAVGTVVVVPLALIMAPEEYALMTAERLLYLCGSVAIGGVFGSICSVMALRRVGVARATPLTNTSPLFAMLFSFLILREPLHLAMVPGTLLVIAGVWLISSGRTAIAGAPISRRDLYAGLGFALATAASWGIMGVILSLGVEGISSIVANSVRMPVVAVLSLAVAAGRGQFRELEDISGRDVLLILLAGTLGYGLLSTLFVSAVQALGPSMTQVISTTTPLFAMTMGMLFLGERPTRRTALGAALAVLGVVIVLVL